MGINLARGIVNDLFEDLIAQMLWDVGQNLVGIEAANRWILNRNLDTTTKTKQQEDGTGKGGR